jgi:hypothetical protein
VVQHRTLVFVAAGEQVRLLSRVLPRIKMTYQRHGTEVYTVPCADSVPMSMPFNVTREVAAFWRYYLRRVA